MPFADTAREGAQAGTVSLANLALWLSWPSLMGEFGPRVPWEAAQPGGDAAGPDGDAAWPAPDPALTSLREAFADSVQRCAGAHQVIGVSVSGGLDSLAVLAAACRIGQAQGRRVVAVAAEMTDDAGQSNVPVVTGLVEALGLPCELRVAPAGQAPAGEPDWSPGGPRLDALPSVNRLIAETAAASGAGILLGGNGADELLGVGRYLLGRLPAAAGWRSARGYWRDTVGVDRGALFHELLATAAAAFPGRLRALAYLASSSPELCQPAAPAVVGEGYRDHVARWSRQWLRELVGWHAARHRSWAVMEAWDAVFPLHVLPGAGPIPLRHPFLDAAFVRTALSLPLDRRYDARLETAYWRQKAQVVSLLPVGARPFLPRAKQTFGADLARRHQQAKRPARRLADLGLIDARAWETEQDAVVVHRVNAVDAWLEAALSAGCEISSGLPARAGRRRSAPARPRRCRPGR